MSAIQRGLRLFPSRFARIIQGLPVFRRSRRDLRSISFQPSTDSVFPDGDVVRQFPDAVRARERPRRRLAWADPFQRFPDRRAVPSVTFISTFELIEDSF